jgi:hypothetical protein
LLGLLAPGIVFAAQKADAVSTIQSAEADRQTGVFRATNTWRLAVRTTRSLFVAAVAVGLAAAPARAGLVATQVTGSAELNFIPINVFDPANGFVPAVSST